MGVLSRPCVIGAFPASLVAAGLGLEQATQTMGLVRSLPPLERWQNIAVAAYNEDGGLTGAHGDAAYSSSGAAYVFSRNGTHWAQRQSD